MRTAFLFLTIIVSSIVQAEAETQIERGKYLATVMDCGGCHTTGSLSGQPDPKGFLAGANIGWEMPVGIVYAANITPDPETGIGKWTKGDIVKLIRTGVRPDGREVAPIMNWRSYGQLTDRDLDALVAYMQSVPPVRHKVPDPVPTSAVKTPYLTIKTP